MSDEGRAPHVRDDRARVPQVREDGFVEDAEAEPLVVRRQGRRVRTGPVDAASREPAPEAQQRTENDERLRGDRPPHWG